MLAAIGLCPEPNRSVVGILDTRWLDVWIQVREPAVIVHYPRTSKGEAIRRRPGRLATQPQNVSCDDS